MSLLPARGARGGRRGVGRVTDHRRPIQHTVPDTTTTHHCLFLLTPCCTLFGHSQAAVTRHTSGDLITPREAHKRVSAAQIHRSTCFVCMHRLSQGVSRRNTFDRESKKQWRLIRLVINLDRLKEKKIMNCQLHRLPTFYVSALILLLLL